MTGRVIGIGLGPGAPDLVTLRAARRLAAAQTVCYVAAEGRPSRARAIAAGFLTHGVEEIAVPIPMRRDRAGARERYAAAAERVTAAADAGREVAVLCEGDPLFYASFGYLRECLAERVPVEVIPGLTAVGAAAARLTRPLTWQDHSLAVMTAVSADAMIRQALAHHDALAILKAGPHRTRIARLIETAGRGHQTAYLEHVGQADEAVYPGLSSLPAGPGGYFGLFVIYPEAVA